MRIKMESTANVVTIVAGRAGEVPARVWIGETESGIRVRPAGLRCQRLLRPHLDSDIHDSLLKKLFTR